MSKASVKKITDPKLSCRQKIKLNKTNKQTKHYAVWPGAMQSNLPQQRFAVWSSCFLQSY